MKKRLLAVLLSVALVVSFVPFSAFAYEAPAEGTSTPAVTVPAEGDGIVSVNGENLYVYDDEIATETFAANLAADAGIDAAAVAGTKFIGVRFKIDDNSPAYRFQNSRFQVSVKLDGVEYRIDDWMGANDGNHKKATNWFVDFNDASLTKFANAGGIFDAHSRGIDTLGNVDGIMLFPISNNAAITEELLAKFEGLTVSFTTEGVQGRAKASSWAGKTAYVGDVLFVDDYDAFYEEYIAVTGNKKYNLNNGGTAYTFAKVGPFRSYYRDYNTNSYAIKVTSNYGLQGMNVNEVGYNGDNKEHYLAHVSTLPNGDRAVVLKFNDQVPDYGNDPAVYIGKTAIPDMKDENNKKLYRADYRLTIMDSYRNGIYASDSRLNSGFNGDGRQVTGPKDAKGNWELATDNTKYLVARVAIAGGVTSNTVHWQFKAYLNANAGGTPVLASLINGEKYKFIDATTGAETELSFATNKFTTVGNIDGYLVVPFDKLTSTVDATKIKEKAWAVEYNLLRGFYAGKTLYAGDNYLVEDLEQFKKSMSTPDVKYTSDDSSITVTNAPTDGSVEYSFNGGEWTTESTFTGLAKDTKYSLSARYTGCKKVITIDAWTSFYSTHIGDGASYLMNVYDEPTAMLGSISGGATTTAIWSANNMFAKQASGAYGNNQYVYVKDIDGETFIEFDIDEAKLPAKVNQMRIHFNAFYGSEHAREVGVPDSIDTSNVKALAYRVKVTSGTEGITSQLGLFFGNGGFGFSKFKANGGYLIDYATRQITYPEWTGNAVFDSNEFDGWIVVPFEAMANSYKGEEGYTVKQLVLGEVPGGEVVEKNVPGSCTAHEDIQVVLYSDDNPSSWANRNFYIGDVLMVEDHDKFFAARTSCDVVGHEYESVVTAPTCTEDGYTTYTCKYCGDEKVDDIVKAEGHKYAEEVIEPDCMNGGYTIYTCDCGDTYEGNFTEPVEHAWEIIEEQAPTCTEPGYIYKECPDCGEASEEFPEALNHNYEESVTEATCTVPGSITYTCSICGDSFSEETGLADHKYESSVTAPTCTAKGYTTHTCTVCSHSYTDSETDMIAHNYESEVTAPTCTAKGYTTHTCTVCNDSYTDSETDMIAHSYGEGVVTAPTATEQGYTTYTCTVCQYSYKDNFVPATGEPEVLYNLQLTETDEYIKVTWDAVENATKYNLIVKNEENVTLYTRALAADATSAYLTWRNGDVEWDKTYKVTLQPRTTKWLTASSLFGSLQVGDRIVDIKTESVGRTIKVTWRAYEGATEYRAYVYTKEGTYVTNVKVTTNSAIIVNAINPEVDYIVKVLATKGTPSMPAANALAIPARLNVFTPNGFWSRGLAPNRAAVSWDEVRGTFKYWAYLTPVNGGETLTRESKKAIANFTGLTPNTEYQVRMRLSIVDADGNTHYSETATLGTFTTPGWEDISFTSVATDAGAELSWNAHTNASGYIIYRATNGTSFKKLATITDPSQLSYVDANAKNGYAYAIIIKVKDDQVSTSSPMIKLAPIVK